MMTERTPYLSRIKVNANRSEETPCFTAKLEWTGRTYTVSNQGRGGANDYKPFLSSEVQGQLDQWAAANNPPITECGGYPINPPLPMSFETWTFGKAFECAS